MANHGYVKTANKMTVGSISEMLLELNTRLLHEKLVFKYQRRRQLKQAIRDVTWETALGCWYIQYVSEGMVYAERTFWLMTPNMFELQHGGGFNFAWWIDSLIINEVAVLFNGKVTDDGLSGQLAHAPGMYDLYRGHIAGYIQKALARGILKEWLEDEKSFTPKEFWHALEVA